MCAHAGDAPGPDGSIGATATFNPPSITSSNQLDGLSTTRTFWLILGFISVCIVGYTDYVTGAEISFALFYWVPIALVTWFAGATLGTSLALG